MAEILPAVLSYSYEELDEALRSIRGATDWVHVDACDGRLHGQVSWPYDRDDRERFARIAAEEEGLPCWQDFDFEVHLMVREPEREAARWIQAGASRLVVHVEAMTDPRRFFDSVGGRAEIGIALNLDTSPEFIAKLDIPFSFVQCMAIAEVGRQGMPFEESIFQKIEDVKKLLPGVVISVDGGVNRENAKRLIDAGAERLVIGSALIGSDDIKAEIEYFQSL